MNMIRISCLVAVLALSCAGAPAEQAAKTSPQPKWGETVVQQTAAKPVQCGGGGVVQGTTSAVLDQQIARLHKDVQDVKTDVGKLDGKIVGIQGKIDKKPSSSGTVLNSIVLGLVCVCGVVASLACFLCWKLTKTVERGLSDQRHFIDQLSEFENGLVGVIGQNREDPGYKDSVLGKIGQVEPSIKNSLSLLLSGIPKANVLDAKFSELREGVERAVRTAVNGLAQGLSAPARMIQDTGSQMTSAVSGIQRAVADLNGQLASHMKTFEDKVAIAAQKEASLKLREETVEARVNAAVVAETKANREQMKKLQDDLAAVTREAVEKRLEEQRSLVTAKCKSEFDAALTQQLKTQEERLQAQFQAQMSAQVERADMLNQQRELAEKALSDAQARCDAAVGAERSKLAGEQQAHQQTRLECEGLQKTVQETASVLTTTRSELASLQQAHAELSQRLFPAEMLGRADFAPFKAQIENWCSKGLAGAEVVRSALGLFAARKSVSEDMWTLALQGIAVGISNALREEGVDSVSAAAILSKWAQFIGSFTDSSQDAPYFFQLRVPMVGSPIDSSWMKQISSTQVKTVNSWAVYTAMGLRYQADIA